MKLVSVPLFLFLRGRGIRQLAGFYLLAFFLAVSIAPHRHANSFEDLITDGPSDSGVFAEGSPFDDPTAAPHWGSARVRNDDPCLACFHHDFDSATEVIALLALSPTFASMPATPAPFELGCPDTPERPDRSRAPPALA